MLANDFQPNWIQSPGEVIAQFMMLSELESSEIDSQTSEILEKLKENKIKINLLNVELISQLIGGTTGFWINLQNQYDLNVERLLNKNLDPEFNEFKLTIRELKAEKWLPISDYSYLDQVNLKTFYGISEFSTLETEAIISNNLGSKLKGIGQYSISDLNLATFVRKVEIEAGKQFKSSNAVWNKDFLISKLENIKTLTKCKKVLDIIPDLTKLLNECGVALVFISPLSKTPICGLAKFINYDKAVIAITPKFNRDHIFWQTLFHELGHLVLHEDNMIFCDENYESNNKSSIELEADNFMFEKLLFPFKSCDISNNINFKLIHYNKVGGWKEICQKAREMNISPSLLTGILKRKNLLPYKYYADKHYSIVD
ncbi:hypothetical protein F966_01384 [Acinetobacter higginsii]|uniref:IrrE N-terminal-like domain-containing protein n=1 Tax=Acinetobacter higginsii TaxID=70347 RepID=N8WE77_9GAMM|nr:ImmA/IrrE family metallo-endopeptidase [Acinetobacter higginsii]ENV10211.1 hypothetical protein F966_01384 [Acinetobacter higginsii]